MSLLKDISVDYIIKMPESATANDMTREVELIERVKDGEEYLIKFSNLAERWKEETFITSSVNVIESNPSYLEIIKMGRKVLPHIFQDLKCDHAFWFHVLEEITGRNPIKYDHRGYVDLMAKDWLKWGEEHGYKDVASEIVDIGNIFEHLEELSDEERQKLIDLIIPEAKISEEERREIHDILEEMESGKEHRLEDVRAELNV